jgi:hypothetical protein
MRPAEPGATSLAKIRTSSALYCAEKDVHQPEKHQLAKRTLASYGGICSPTAASSACIGAVACNRLCCHAVCNHLPVRPAAAQLAAHLPGIVALLEQAEQQQQLHLVALLAAHNVHILQTPATVRPDLPAARSMSYG